MPAIEIGRLCVKIAGRDAGRECLITELQGSSFVIIDGNTRRKRCNVAHLHFLPQIADIKEKASHEEVIKALEKLGISALEKQSHKYTKKPRAAEKPAAEKTKKEKKQAKKEKKEKKPKKKLFGRKKEEAKKEKPAKKEAKKEKKKE